MQKNSLKYDGPQNQDLTPPSLSLEGIQNLSFKYKIIIIIYYFNCIIFQIILKNY